MQIIDELLADAQKRIALAQELLKSDDWLRGIYELGAATARIYQVVEETNKSLSSSPPG